MLGHDVGDLLELVTALGEGLGETVLLGGELGHDGLALLEQIGIEAFVDADDQVGHLGGEACGQAQVHPVTHGATDKATQDVVGAHVAGLHAALGVAQDDGGRAHMVGNDTLGANALLLGQFVRGQRADALQQRQEELGLIDIGVTVDHADGALDAHAGVDVVLLERLVGPLGRLVVLHEDVVPNLHVLAAMTPGAAVRAARGLAGVQEHLGVRAAGAGDARRAPPVVLAPLGEDMALGNALRLPASDGFVVARDALFALEDGHVEVLGLQPQLGGEELKAPGNGLLLEVIAQRPVAEHLEEGQVRAVAHRVDVAGAHALLHVGQAAAGRMGLTEQIGHQRVHARRREQHGRVVLGDDRGPGNNRVPLALEKLQIHLAQRVGGQLSHCMLL